MHPFKRRETLDVYQCGEINLFTNNIQVFGIKRILTSPALLESTSLVFAYGLDTFFTQSSPSRQFDVLSEDFSKSQLILTMVGLVVAIAIARPIVRRKRVNALWQ